MTITGTSGNDNLNGTSGADSFDMSQGGNDKVFGLGDNDTFGFGAALGVRDEIDGGAGNDLVTITGDYSAGLALRASSLISVETFSFGGGFDYDVTFVDANFTGTFTIDGRDLGATNSLTIDASADTDTAISAMGGAGDDVIKTGGGNDSFTLGLGNDTAYGGAGVDTFQFNTNSFGTGDALFGGADTDFLSLFGDYSAGLTITKDMIDSIEVMFVGGAFDYDLTFKNKSVDTNLAINASGGGAGQKVMIDAHSVKSGALVFVGGAADDVVAGGSLGDSFNIGASGGKDDLDGNGGDDTFSFNDTLTAKDRIDGGDGNDLVALTGNYGAGVIFGAKTMKGVETLFLGGDHSYSFTLDDANIAAGAHLSVNANSVAGGNTLILDASAETDGSLTVNCAPGDCVVTAGAGNDALNGAGGNDQLSAGGGADAIFGGEGADALDGGSGADTFSYGAISESTSTIRDTITGFNANADKFDLSASVADVDAQITMGALSAGNFDTQLAAAVNAGNLAVGHAVLFTASGGNLAGHTYLVIESGGGAGYQAGQDLVMELVAGGHLTSLSMTNFI